MPDIVVDPFKKNTQGVRDEVGFRIQKVLEGGRRYFGSSGAALTRQLAPEYKDKGIDSTLAKIGLQGERDTTTMLKEWMKDKPNVVLCDSVHIRGWGKEEVDPETGMIDGGDTDHVLLIGDEIILIDSKRWKKKSNYQVGDDGNVLRANKPFPGGTINMVKAIHMWLDYLDEDSVITGFVHINSEDVTVFRNRNWFTKSYRLVEKDKFIELLDEKYNDHTEDYDKEHINSTLVAQVALSTVKPYDERSRVFDMKSLKGIR